jgi:hypothetical protein
VFKPVACAVVMLAAAAPVAAQGVRNVPVTANDLAYSPMTGRLYASVAATNSITEIDPVAGAVGVSFVVGGQPNRLAMSDTGEYLYVGLDGLPGVVRVHLPTRAVGTPFTLGNHPLGFPFGPRAVDDMEVLPGNADAVAISRRYGGLSPHHAGVAIYDSGVERAAATETFEGISNVIEFGASAARLYGYDHETTGYGFRRMDVAPTGVGILDSTPGLIEGFFQDIEYAAGRIYATTGVVVDAEARTVVTSLDGLSPSGNLVEPTNTTIYYLTTNNSSTWRLKGFDATTFAPTSEGTVAGVGGTPRSLVATGTDALAFATTAGQVYLLTPSLMPATAPTITITSPTSSPTASIESATVTLAGVAADPNGTVTRIAWVTSRGHSGTANGTTAWTAGDIPLAIGPNTITVTATDDSGLTQTDTLTVTVAAFTSFLAEGSTGGFFDYDLAIANPSIGSVTAEIVYYMPGGATYFQNLTVPGESRRTIRVDELPGLENAVMSTSVRTTDTPLVVERTMRWGVAPDPQYGAHTDRATAGAALRWYFAEGAQGFFYTYLLLANPDASANTATVDWLIEGAPAVRRTVNLAPRSRTTIDAGADPALVGRSFGIIVTFAAPAVAERAMYFGTEPLFKAGHDSAGVTTPSTRWFLAEGATGPFFETFILLANPNPTPADATLQFLTQSGASVTRTVTIPAMARHTIDIEGLSPAAPELANEAVATVVTATQPIVAERAQYWPGVGNDWYEAHNSFGVMDPRLVWGLAEGRVGNPPGVPAANYQTYILVANPGSETAHVSIRFLRENAGSMLRQFTVPAGRRLNISVAGAGSSVPDLSNEHFGALLRSDQPVVVERALYGNAGTQVFGIGTNATATPLP